MPIQELAMNPSAIHEAGHVMVLLCKQIKVLAVVRKDNGQYCVRSTIAPYEVPPSTMIFVKIAGKVAVEIQNEKCGCQHDTGYDGSDENSDGKCIDKINKYLIEFGVAHGTIGVTHDKFEACVRAFLVEKWLTVQAIANKIEQVTIKNGSDLSAMDIGAVIASTDPEFFAQAKNYLDGR